ncbi:hypothetical protein [Bradyrhizobium prioriisuperbiae]|uniref:hypothetical protein n=1 Tax=Bradyrhizobium prioriisuperbiae TaxID=2854389 RepID=UPI0028ECE865|nr:hypothetical protein [Bradyrhizobium prioritasuperba]
MAFASSCRTRSCARMFGRYSRCKSAFYQAIELEFILVSILFCAMHGVAEQKLAETEAYEVAWKYWSCRLNNIPPAPALPMAIQPRAISSPRFDDANGSLRAARRGAFAEEMISLATRAVRLPEDVDLRSAAAYRAPYCSTLYALNTRVRLIPSERLVVMGAAGGVGLAAMQSSLIGVKYGAGQDRDLTATAKIHADLLGRISQGNLKPRVTAESRLEQVCAAMDVLASRKTSGKSVLQIRSR